tara:strand:- start:3672 stop:3887 length:216 start_codon:yes stop_codon:yes gene_type:complete
MNNYLKISILAVVISGIVFHETKPEVFYREGEFKEFGLNNEQTVLPLWLALVIIGFFVYSVQILNEGKYIV